MKLILVRHGQTDWNVEGRFQGSADVPLNEIGHLQAQSMAQQIVEFDPNAIVTSNLMRAQETAAALAVLTGLTPTVENDLHEIYIGGWQGLLPAEVEERFPEEYAAWKAGEDIHRGGGENFVEAGQRGAGVIRRLLVDNNKTVVVVAHGILLRETMRQLVVENVIAFRGDIPHLHNAEWIALDLV